MLEEVLTGAITHGVNASTFLLINALLLLAVVSLAALVLVSWSSAPALVPHAAFLLFLALGLWALIIWFVISVIGFVDPEKQRKELGGGDAAVEPNSSAQPPANGTKQQQQQSGGQESSKKQQ